MEKKYLRWPLGNTILPVWYPVHIMHPGFILTGANTLNVKMSQVYTRGLHNKSIVWDPPHTHTH